MDGDIFKYHIGSVDAISCQMRCALHLLSLGFRVGLHLIQTCSEEHTSNPTISSILASSSTSLMTCFPTDPNPSNFLSLSKNEIL